MMICDDNSYITIIDYRYNLSLTDKENLIRYTECPDLSQNHFPVLLYERSSRDRKTSCESSFILRFWKKCKYSTFCSCCLINDRLQRSTLYIYNKNYYG